MRSRGAEWLFATNTDSYLADPERKSPEKRLLAAILVRAAQDAVSQRGIEPHFRRNARLYFGLHKSKPNLNRSNGGSFSFAEICDYLNLCPFTIHRNLQFIMWDGGIKRSQSRGTSGNIIWKLYE